MKKFYCTKGHTLHEENIVKQIQGTDCLICHDARQAAYKKRTTIGLDEAERIFRLFVTRRGNVERNATEAVEWLDTFAARRKKCRKKIML